MELSQKLVRRGAAEKRRRQSSSFASDLRGGRTQDRGPFGVGREVAYGDIPSDGDGGSDASRVLSE